MSDEARDYQREGWVRVATLAEMPEGEGVAVEAAGRALVLVRRGESVSALDNACPHAGAPLSEGFVEGDLIVCAWHGWTFDLSSGESPDMPGTCVARCPVEVVDGDVLVRPN